MKRPRGKVEGIIKASKTTGILEKVGRDGSKKETLYGRCRRKGAFNESRKRGRDAFENKRGEGVKWGRVGSSWRKKKSKGGAH